MKIGIALLAYSRPNHTSKVILGIINERIKEITVYIDGPEDNKILQDQKKILKILDKFKKKIKINLVQQQKNNGLAFSVTNAVKSELNKNDAVILLEDDCVPQKGFFKYMISSLKKYKNNKKVRSICSYINLDIKDKKHSIFLKRFNPWGWATWKDRWKNYIPDIKIIVKELNSVGKIDNLPLDLKTFSRNQELLGGKQDIWSLSWTLSHYLDESLILFPPRSLIRNIGFDGSGVHCIKTKIFNVKNKSKNKNISFPSEIRLNFKKEITNNKFLIDNSSKTYFKNNNLGVVEPYSFLKRDNFVTYDKITYFVEKFVYSAKIIDIHTHLYPNQFKKYYKFGLIDLLNYHYLIAEFLSSSKITPNKFYSLSDIQKAKIIWDNLFLKKLPLSTASLGVLKVLQKYEITNFKINFYDLLKEVKKQKITENDIFDLSGVQKVVMTNNPFIDDELKILNNSKDPRFLPSIRIDDFFNSNLILKDEIRYFRKIIKKYKPSYFALSSNNLEEFDKSKKIELLLKLLRIYNIPLMLLLGVKRNINPEYRLAGDGIGELKLKKLEYILKTYNKNNFLVSCLNKSDQFRLTVIARKFQNIKVFGFWWFNNQESIIKDNLKLRFELLGDNFIIQHSDARVCDQLIYKWNDFKKHYTDILSSKFKELVESGAKLEISDIEKYVYEQFYNQPKKAINIK